jgi:hypothetical protein
LSRINAVERDGQVLAANGGVLLQEDFLSQEDFIRMQRWAYSVNCDQDRKMRRWDMAIVRDFSDCMSSRQWSSAQDDIPDEARFFIDAVKKAGMVEPDATVVIGVLRWQPKSGMGEHTDGHSDTAITYYLNDIWKKSWCGDFIFYESLEDFNHGYGRAVSPLANRLVINKSRVMHKVTYCSELAVERVTLQAFVQPA